MRASVPVLTLAAMAAFAATTVRAETPVAQGSADAVPASPYPQTRAEDRVQKRFGAVVADPYRWLENDVRIDAEVRGWVNAQNEVTQSFLKTLPLRETFAKRIEAITNFERMGVPRKGGQRYFFTRNNGLQNQSVLMVREGLAGAEKLLLDPNSWAKDGATALAEWTPSPDGRYLLYAEQDGGTDWRTLRVIDVETGQALSDTVKWVKFSNISWKKDGSGFFYSRFAAPKEGAKYQATNLHQSVWFHALGTAQEADVKIYATPRFPKRGHVAQVTDDGRYLLITTSEGTDERYELHVASLDKDSPATPQPLVAGLQNDWQLAGTVGSTFYFRTDLGAPRGRVVALDVDAPAPREIIAQSSDTLVGASLVGNRLIIAYLGDAKSEAELHSLDGKLIAPIRLPGIGSAGGFGGDAGDPETFYSFSSYAVAPTIYRLDTETGKAELFFAPKTAFNADDFVTDQRFYTSKDGTKVPLFLVSRKDRKGPAPALLYGYGGFNSPQTPAFNAQRLAWVEQGGVLAVANLRGGGEYGKEWHDAGRLARKQNVFDDFIAAGEYLINEGLTEKGRLAIEGRSNGGLLVGAVVNQRPDLFAAALPIVGVMDMLRFNQFTAGRYWVDDYGDPAKKDDFKVLRSYSPYHNIRSGSDYPAVLVLTADTDDRVVPGHSFKYAAALQAAQPGGKPKLIRIDTRAGHGSGKPTDKLIAEFADAYAFIAHFTGMEAK